jgi:hypothetical protein
MKLTHLILYGVAPALITWFSWPVISTFTEKEIQPISSAISTFSGILLGFVLASISLFASAKDNRLIRNTQLTGYLPKLISKLHITMGLLITVCLIFLIALFMPDSAIDKLTLKILGYNLVCVRALVALGVFVLINSFTMFYVTWCEFKNFTKHM